MKFFKPTIFTGFAPNLRMADVLTACGFLFLPWKWSAIHSGKYTKKVEDFLKKYLSINHVFCVDSGRSAILIALKILGVQHGDEVIVQAYTCVVVVNAITALGAKPVYVDIGEDLSILTDEDLIKKITTKTKAIIIQHTFGSAANLNSLLVIAKKKNIRIVEDCAQALGAEYNKKKLGTFGDIGVFSFGSNKIISSVRGGAMVTNNLEIAKKIEIARQKLKKQKNIETIKHLLHFPLFFISKPIYHLGLGKLILGICKSFNILPKIISHEEKSGVAEKNYPALLANSLAKIAFFQLHNLNKNLAHREIVAKHYRNNLFSKIDYQEGEEGRVWLYYTIFVNNYSKLAQKLKKEGVIVGTDWSGAVIVPKDVSLSHTKYIKGSCPNAEDLSKQITNLPTNINVSIKKADRIIKLVNKYY